MFEARILQGQILKKIIEAMRELVTDANLECHAEMGITMQVGVFYVMAHFCDASCGRDGKNRRLISLICPH